MTVRNAASMGTYNSSWQHNGYSGAGNVKELLDLYQNRPAIVAGNADGVFTEYHEAMDKLIGDPVIFGVNDIGMYLPKLDHFVSLHTDFLGAWKTVRWLHPMPSEVTKYHGVDARPYADYVWEGLTPLFCLSGYFAMQIAWLMGCRPIVLIGCPGNPARRFFDLDVRNNFGYGGMDGGSDVSVKEQVVNEMKRLPAFKEQVRSLSGWTKSYFGGLD